MMIHHFYQKEWKLKYTTSLFDKNKNNYVLHIRTLKQALSSIKIVRKVIQFNQKVWLKPYWYKN